MAGRGRLPPHGGRGGPFAGHGLHRGGPGHFGQGMPPHLGPGFDPIEEKLATQHAEIQRLATENQRLAATHIALRQELAAANQEMQRMQQALASIQADNEQHIRSLAEKTAKMEADLLATEPLKAELQQLEAEAQKLIAHRQELTAQLQQVTQDLHRSRADLQQIPNLKAEVDALRQEMQRARSAFEYEKKANIDLLEQRQAMEKNLVTLAREVEKLRAELAATEKKPRGGAYGGYGASDSAYPSNVYGDGYGSRQVAAAENGGPFGSGPPSSWGGFDAQRGGATHARR